MMMHHNEADYIKLKYSKGLKEIQNKYKIRYMKQRRYTHKNNIVLKYGFYRLNPFAIQSIQHILKNQKNRLIEMVQNEKSNNNIATYLEITFVISLNPKYIKKDDADLIGCVEQSTRCIRFNEDTLDRLLEKFADRITQCWKEHAEKGRDIWGIQGLNFSVVCDKRLK